MERSVVSNPSQQDCISFLPDEILHSILSHIPTKSAISTSVLSKRWKQVWRETPSISINCITDCPRVDPTSLNKTLRSFSAPKIPSFNLIIRDNVTASQIDSWIELAMSRNAEYLSLTVFNYSFPESFFINSSLKQLSVALYSHQISPTCIVSWPSLRSLSLSNCHIPNKSIANILSGCAMLEILTLKAVSGLDDLDISKSMRLTRLEIVCKDRMRRPLKIVAPHIHYLSLKLSISLQPCILVDVSSLTEANLSTAVSGRGYSNANFDLLQEMLLKILRKLQNIEKLTIGDVKDLQFLSLAELRGVPFPQFKIKDLTVVTTIFQSVIPGIVRLIQNSLGLKRITIRTTMHSAISDKELEGYLNTQRLNPDQCWTGKYGNFSKVYSESKHVVSFIELVLRKAKTLETMVLQLQGFLSATEFQKLLSMLPTVSFRNKKCQKLWSGEGDLEKIQYYSMNRSEIYLHRSDLGKELENIGCVIRYL